MGAGGQFVFSAPWEQVCRALTELANCDCEMIRAGTCSIFNSGVLNRTPTLSIQGGTDTLVLNFRLYAQSQVLASAGQSGALTQFSIYPGDEKVYMEEPNIVGYTEGSINANVKQIRVFIGTGSFNNAYVQNDGTGVGETIGDPPTFLSVDGNGIDQVIDGLENDIVYHFRTASVDEAGNIYAFMDNAYIKDPAGGNCPNPELTYGGNRDTCRYYGTPSKVLGLLSEDLNCFVATAAYGSALDPHIDTFRKFRFKVLLRSELGKKLNYAYYNYGPKLSRFIKDRPWAQMTARAILWPAWGFASISLYLGLNTWQSLLLFLTTTSLFGYGLFLISRRLLGKGLIL